MKIDILKQQEYEYFFPYHYVPVYRKYFSQTFNWEWGLNYTATIEFLVNKLKEINFFSICDVGCGDGRLIHEINSVFKNIKITGIDNSNRALSFAKLFNPGIEFINKDLIFFDKTRKFDLITLIEVFEHIPILNCNDFIFSISKMLNKNGYLFITVPHVNKRLNPKHYQHFTKELIINYIKEYFNLEEIIFFDKLCKTQVFLKKLLTNNFFILNNKKILNLIYIYYKKNLFFTNENNCARMFLKLKKI